MRWLTTEEIERCSKTRKGAWRVSVEHWFQIKSATREEFDKAVLSGKVSISAQHCGLCRRGHIYGSCDLCPAHLSLISIGCCDGLWRVADELFKKYKEHPTNKTFAAFQEAATKVWKYLLELEGIEK